MEWLRLVNSEYPLKKEDIPKRLVHLHASKVYICKEVRSAFRRLNLRLKLYRLEPLVLVSGYRSYTYQEELFNRKTHFYMNQGQSLIEAQESASHIVARPGTSEHQTGLAIDVTTRSMRLLDDPLITDFAQSPTGAWLTRNCYKEGFILRYPKNKVEITHITYEPWHYRYVGKKAAYHIYKQQLCLEEYVLMHKG